MAHCAFEQQHVSAKRAEDVLLPHRPNDGANSMVTSPQETVTGTATKLGDQRPLLIPFSAKPRQISDACSNFAARLYRSNIAAIFHPEFGGTKHGIGITHSETDYPTDSMFGDTSQEFILTPSPPWP